MSKRLAALKEMEQFFNRISGKRDDRSGEEELKPQSSHKDPKMEREEGEGLQHEKAESPTEEFSEHYAEEGFDDGSEDGVMNSDPQRKDGKMPEAEKPQGSGIPKLPKDPTTKTGQIDVKEIMRKAGRTGSGQKGSTMQAGVFGHSSKK